MVWLFRINSTSNARQRLWQKTGLMVTNQFHPPGNSAELHFLNLSSPCDEFLLMICERKGHIWHFWSQVTVGVYSPCFHIYGSLLFGVRDSVLGMTSSSNGNHQSPWLRQANPNAPQLPPKPHLTYQTEIWVSKHFLYSSLKFWDGYRSYISYLH